MSKYRGFLRFMSKKPSDSKNISFELHKRVSDFIEDEDNNGEKCSNSEFAKRVGVNKSVISNIVNYGIIPTVPSLIKIADYENVSLSYLLGKTNKSEFEKSEHPTTFHCRVLELLKEQGVKFSTITNQCSFSRNSLHVWLKRKNLPSVDYLFELAKAFKVSPDYLLGRTDYKERNS